MGQADRATIQAILAGDKEAYGALVKRHSRTLFRLAYRMTGNEADADDVVQEAFLRGYLKLDQFESRADFGTWIYRIAAHCAIDRLNARNKEERNRIVEENEEDRESVQVADVAPGPERLVLSAEIGALQQVAMQGLSTVERAAFVLRHFEGKGTGEIAAALNVDTNAAKQAVFRAVRKVRQRLTYMKVTA